jgi:hypothetical protein
MLRLCVGLHCFFFFFCFSFLKKLNTDRRVHHPSRSVYTWIYLLVTAFRRPAVTDYTHVVTFMSLEISGDNSRAWCKQSRRLVKGATINGVTYEGVGEFIYLGTLISNDNSVEEEIQRRILTDSRTYFAAIIFSGKDFYPELPKFYYMRH